MHENGTRNGWTICAMLCVVVELRAGNEFMGHQGRGAKTLGGQAMVKRTEPMQGSGELPEESNTPKTLPSAEAHDGELCQQSTHF